MSPELILAIYGTLIAPLLVALGTGLNSWWRGRGERARLVAYLAGLPDELQVVLAHYYVEGAHTLGGNPSDVAVAQLRHMGLVKLGSGRGGYDAVDSYLMLRADVAEALPALRRKSKRFRALTDELARMRLRELAQQEADKQGK